MSVSYTGEKNSIINSYFSSIVTAVYLDVSTSRDSENVQQTTDKMRMHIYAAVLLICAKINRHHHISFITQPVTSVWTRQLTRCSSRNGGHHEISQIHQSGGNTATN
jgi:hypothetical protein